VKSSRLRTRPDRRSTRLARLVATATGLAVVACVSGCEPAHISEYATKQRDYTAGKYATLDPKSRPAEGSIFSEAVGGYFEDTRAVRQGDIVVVRIDESADASGDSTTQLSRDSEFEMGIPNIFGLVAAIQATTPDLDPSTILSLFSNSDFDGRGNTSRKGELRGSIAVRITREMPNGDLFIEGTKVVMINNEEYHLYVSGLIRRADIADDNSIPSSRIADAEIEFTGRGDLADQQRKGIIGRGLDKVAPF
jgi:flagellar L-ring protein precursor FlgH